MCQDPDNFRVENPDMYVSQSGQFLASCRGLCWHPGNFGRETKFIRSGVPPKNSFYYDFSGLFGMSMQNPDNFSYLAEVCVTFLTISCSEFVFASRQFSIGLTHTS
jgi:hypothetical protein